jgi:DeoR/GlpR family transcriptional regulator of sugar metabolism
MKAEPRRKLILELLEKTGVLSVGELADRFALTEVTIRKDLDDLASEGLLERAFGGAVFSNTGPTKHFSALRALLPKGGTAPPIPQMHRSRKPSYGPPSKRMSW